MGPIIERRPQRLMDQDPAADGASPELPLNPEKPLAGKVAIVTGTRGIAEKTIEAMARKGIAVVIATHIPVPDTPMGKNKLKRVEKLKESVAGINAETGGNTILDTQACELTNNDQLDQLTAYVHNTYGHVDILYHNAAGGFIPKKLDEMEPGEAEQIKGQSREASLAINYGAKIELTGRIASLMSPNGVVVNIESPLSEYWGTDIKGIPEYDPVAEGKYAAKEELPDFVEEMNIEHGKSLRYVEICATLVEGTITASMLTRGYKEQMAEIMDSSVTTDDVAAGILRVITNDVPNGHVEYLGIPNWDKKYVEKRLDVYDRKVDKMVFPQPNLGFGHYAIKIDDMMPMTDPKRIVIFEGPHEGVDSPDGYVTFEAYDTKGHFDVVRGVQQLDLAVQVAKAVARETGNNFHLKSLDGMKFAQVVYPEDTVDVYVTSTIVDGDEMKFEIVQSVNGNATAEFTGLTLKKGEDPRDNLKPMMVEIAAQTGGLEYIYEREQASKGTQTPPDNDTVPLFRGTGKITWEDMSGLEPDSEVVTQSSITRKTPVRFFGDLTMRSGTETVMKIEKLECAVLPREKAIALLEREK